MFQTGVFTRVAGYTAKEAITKYAPDGKVVGEVILGVGSKGSEKYPVFYVRVTVWEKLAEEAESVLDRKGIAVEASGMLWVRLYEGKHGTANDVELRGVRELRVYDRAGEVKVLSGVAEAE